MAKEKLFDDWSGRLWILHDDAIWKELCTKVGITENLEQARLDLDRILCSSKHVGAIKNREARKILKDLASRAKELLERAEQNVDKHDLVWLALRNAGINDKGRQIGGRNIEGDLRGCFKNLLILSNWLDKAENLLPKGKPGAPGILPLIEAIDTWHVKYAGGGLQRPSSDKNQKRRPDSDRYKLFVNEVLKLAGIEAEDGGVEETMKKAIKKRHTCVG